MKNYKSMYFELLLSQLEAIEKLEEITESLIKAHKDTEELYMSINEKDSKIMILRDEYHGAKNQTR